jgi:TFIIF-interacting CTD phosphatase-like protein
MKLVVLDLDSTLLYTDDNVKDAGAGTYTLNFGDEKMKGVWRPYWKTFLTEINNNFDVGIWSAGTDEYVKEIAKLIKKVIPLKFVFTRDQCDILTTKTDILHQKPLSSIFELFPEYNYKNTIIIDDTPDVAYDNPINLIHIKKFEGKPDKELLKVLDKLLKNSNIKDVAYIK